MQEQLNDDEEREICLRLSTEPDLILRRAALRCCVHRMGARVRRSDITAADRGTSRAARGPMPTVA